MKSAGERTAGRLLAACGTLCALLRLALFLGTISVLCVAVGLHRVRADIDERLAGLGTEMMRFPGVHRDEARDVHLNGARISLRALTVQRPLTDVLTHYEQLCARHGVELFRRIADTLGAPAQLPAEALASIATLRRQGRQSGYVACVDPASSLGSHDTFPSRLLEFARTEELGELGGLRFAFAQRSESDPAASTLLVTIWADAELGLRQLLPRGTADAPGLDLAGFPRAPGTQRILSAWEEDRPSGVFIYRAPSQSPESVESFYRESLPLEGWALVERYPGEAVLIDGVRILAAHKERRIATLLVHAKGDRSTTLTVLSSEPR